MSYYDDILALTRQLYPTGRAFKMPFGGWLDSLHRGLAFSENKAWTDALGLRDSLLPDNANFFADDTAAWERRLGMITNDATPIADRNAAILRKLSYRRTQRPREHYLYIQAQLQAANFDVYVYENRFPDGMGGYYTQDPITLSGGAGVVNVQHETSLQHGDAQHGGEWQNIIANYIDASMDANFYVGSNLRATFFIGGAGGAGTQGYVPTARKDEFRQLLLTLKPLQTVGFLFITYI